jgi:hypothetical protein
MRLILGSFRSTKKSLPRAFGIKYIDQQCTLTHPIDPRPKTLFLFLKLGKTKSICSYDTRPCQAKANTKLIVHQLLRHLRPKIKSSNSEVQLQTEVSINKSKEPPSLPKALHPCYLPPPPPYLTSSLSSASSSSASC